MMVGIVGKAAEYTLRIKDFDPLAAGELATRFIMAAPHDLDPALLVIIDALPQAGDQ